MAQHSDSVGPAENARVVGTSAENKTKQKCHLASSLHWPQKRLKKALDHTAQVKPLFFYLLAA